jgi:hypothetical protein
VLSCKGNGILVRGQQEYFQFLNVNVRPPKDTPRRVMSSTADHVHFNRSLGHFKMLGCEFSYGGDDCINIHDTAAFGVKVSENGIHMKAGTLPATGDVVEFREDDYSPATFTSTVTSVIDRGKPERYIYFRDKIPDPQFDGFVLFNRAYTSSHIIIRDCYFHSNRARGALILGSNVTIENCKFEHHESAAIKFETGYTFTEWSEGFGVNNVVVRNCTFDSVSQSGATRQDRVHDIYFAAYLRRDPSFEQTRYPIISNILFEDNIFKESSGLVALISSSGNVIFHRNTFINNTPRKEETPDRGAFYIHHSSNIKIINNTWVKSPYVTRAGVFVDKDTTKNLVFEGNKFTEKP